MKIASEDTEQQINLSIKHSLVLLNAILGLAFCHYAVYLAVKVFTAIF